MAGENVYIGQLFKAMIDKLSTLLTKIDQQITELQNVKTAVSQNVASLNVKPGTAKDIALTNAAVSAVSGSKGVFTFASCATGKVTLSGGLKPLGGGITGYVYISYDGVTWTQVYSQYLSTVNAIVPFTVNIDVKPGTIFIGVSSSHGTYAVQFEAAAHVKYDVNDIVNVAAFL